MPHDDGAALLTSNAVGELLQAAVAHAGGTLVSWSMDHVDQNPHQSTTATYRAVVDWPYGRRDELLGVSARAGRLAPNDARADIFADGDREVAVWLHPNDPDLPGLARATYPEDVAALCNDYELFPRPVAPQQVRLEMIGYRPRRRAVLRAVVSDPRTVFYIKVLRESDFAAIRDRHRLLLDAGVPAPPVAVATPDCLLVLRELPGIPLARAIFEPQDPCTAEQLIAVLDRMPSGVAQLERRPPWSDAVGHYARMVGTALPAVQPRVAWLASHIEAGLRDVPPGNEPTHGDFHEGQLHTSHGRIVGMLDVDTIGPGRRADDLACLVAHLSTIQRMNAQQAERVRHLLRTWVPVFDERVDPGELRLRAAAVIISLATGPFRSQDPTWERDTIDIIAAAEALVRQVR